MRPEFETPPSEITEMVTNPLPKRAILQREHEYAVREFVNY
jgi:hypothetical protein